MPRLFFIIILAIIIFLPSARCASSLTLQEALDKGLIKVTAKGLGDHLGQSIEMAIMSISKKDIQISINAGLNLIPNDTSVQSIIVTQEKVLALTPNAVRKIKLFAMCTEQTDGCPSENDLFALGTMAEGDLLEVVQFIDKKKFQSLAAQHAIWCITDSANIGGIYDELNPTVAKELRMLVEKLTGKVQPWYSIEYRQQPGVVFTNEPAVIKADFHYTLSEEGLVTFAVYNEAGKVVNTILENHPERPGTSTMKIRIEVREFLPGKYFVRVTDRGKLIEEREFDL